MLLTHESISSAATPIPFHGIYNMDATGERHPVHQINWRNPFGAKQWIYNSLALTANPAFADSNSTPSIIENFYSISNTDQKTHILESSGLLDLHEILFPSAHGPEKEYSECVTDFLFEKKLVRWLD